jgi:peptidoglycan/LPS O-acetylase OafA/YrhL
MQNERVSRHRFLALDSLRGICACLVVFHHFDGNGPIAKLQLIQQSWLFVDFFFVLSGFVIAFGYSTKLKQPGALRAFVVTRFFRLYPLHLIMLLAMIGFELMRYGAGTRPSIEYAHSVYSFFTNLFLIHGLNLHEKVNWNVPSWSISTEWWTYVLYGLIIATAKANTARTVFLSITVLVPLFCFFWLDHGLNLQTQFGLIRCLFGFSVGVLCQQIWHRSLRSQNGNSTLKLTYTFVELLSITLTIWFICSVGEGVYSLVAPFVFGATLLCFSVEKGYLSHTLKLAPLHFLGTISYSIYMTHWLVHLVIFSGLAYLSKHYDWQLLAPIVGSNGQTIMVAGKTPLQGTFAYCLMLLVCIATSWLSYRLIEIPGKKIGTRLLEQKNEKRNEAN